jgi:endonuclease YncB( thermonuclease family)
MRLLVVLLIVLLIPAFSAAENLAGRVVKIVDGDTVYFVDANRQKHKIRLSGIAAGTSV